MYIRRVHTGGATRHILRESLWEGDCWRHRDLMDLGQDPGLFIEYPGGNGFYYKPELEECLDHGGVHYSQEDLDEIFLPYMAPNVRRVLENFGVGRGRRNRWKGLSDDELWEHQKHLHPFDRRRLHFLRVGRVDMGNLEGRPWKFLNVILGKSRDEMEHLIEGMEQLLRPHEMRLYLYSSLELDSYFSGSLLRHHPAALDPEKVDGYFLEELCRLNGDGHFLRGVGNDRDQCLHPFLVRYAILYFDHSFPNLGEGEYVREFIRRRRAYVGPPARKRTSIDEACRVLGLSRDRYTSMTRRELLQFYRKCAHETHPDKGGDHDAFVRMSEAYECLIEQK